MFTFTLVVQKKRCTAHQLQSRHHHIHVVCVFSKVTSLCHWEKEPFPGLLPLYDTSAPSQLPICGHICTKASKLLLWKKSPATYRTFNFLPELTSDKPQKDPFKCKLLYESSRGEKEKTGHMRLQSTLTKVNLQVGSSFLLPLKENEPQITSSNTHLHSRYFTLHLWSLKGMAKEKIMKGTKRWVWFSGSGVDIYDNYLKAGYLWK